MKMRNLLIAALLALVPVSLPAQTGPSTSLGTGDYFLYVGTYTNPNPKTTSASKGIYAWRFDSKTGALTPIGLVAETVNPAHVWAGPDGRVLYAVNWSTADPAGDTVSAFAIDKKTGALKLLNKVSSHGESPNQVVLDPSGRIAVTVTYNGGTVTAYGIQPDGRLTEAIYTEKHAGQPLSAKQPWAARTRRRVLEGRALGLCGAARPRPRVYLSRRSRQEDVCAGGPTVCGDERRRLGPAPSAAPSERQIPLRKSRDRFEGERLHGRRRVAQADPDAVDVAGGLQREQLDGRDPDRSDGEVAVCHQPRPRQHGALRSRSRKGNADVRRPHAVRRPHSAQHHDRSDEWLSDRCQPERREHRRLPDRPEDGRSDANGRHGAGTAARWGVFREESQ